MGASAGVRVSSLVLLLFIGSCGDDYLVTLPDAASPECANAPNGAPCGDSSATACNRADTCHDGACVANVVADGTPCGSASATECDRADSCVRGVCADNVAADGTACGDGSDTECDNPDVCLSGVCAANAESDGTACGDLSDTECDNPDSCLGGLCATNSELDGTACYDCVAGPGLCEACVSGSCSDGPTCDLGDVGSLASPAAGGNFHNGNMFDLVATNTVTITSFDARPQNTTSYQIYVKTGSHVGFEAMPGAWTAIGSAPEVIPADTVTPIPIPVNVTIPAGQTYAFYVTSSDVDVFQDYHDGTARGNAVAADANLTLLEGTGIAYPFGLASQPRVWEGNIHYTRDIADLMLDSSAGTAAGGNVDGLMFDIEAISDVHEFSAMSVELAAGTYDVDIYFRRGSHVGFEGSAAGWQLIGGADGVVSAGGGALSVIPLLGPIDLSAGEIGAFYVDTGVGAAGLQTDPGGAVGDPAVVGPEQSLRVGVAVGGAFGPTGPVSIFRGSLAYGACIAH